MRKGLARKRHMLAAFRRCHSIRIVRLLQEGIHNVCSESFAAYEASYGNIFQRNPASMQESP